MPSLTSEYVRSLRYLTIIPVIFILSLLNIGNSLILPTPLAASNRVNHVKDPIATFLKETESKKKLYKSNALNLEQKDEKIRLFQSRTSITDVPDSNGFEEKVTALLKLIQKKDEESNEEKEYESEDDMKKIISEIEENFATLRSKEESNEESLSRFENLIGLYTVDQVLTKRKNENPVGGKWTRKNSLAKNLFRSRRTFQHILATDKKANQNEISPDSAVAEAVNVISFDALFGLFRMTVMLRGDAIPLTFEERKKLKLTNYAVRAYFDAPRIVFGKRGRICNINLGPKSDVVLDATYVDDVIRIGKGGISGSRFVFKRCNTEDSTEIAEANEFKSLLERRPMRRSKMISIVFAILGCGAYNLKLGRTFLGSLLLLFSGIGGVALKFSTGGIEEDQQMRTAENL